MAKTVADQFVDTLVAGGVRRIYGVVGDSLNALTDSLRTRPEIDGSMCGTRRSLRLPPAPKPTSPDHSRSAQAPADRATST